MGENRMNFPNVSFILAMILILVCASPGGAESLNFIVESGAYRIVEEQQPESKAIYHRIVMDGYLDHLVPGAPVVPVKSLMIGLPPGARVLSIHVKGLDAIPQPGIYHIQPLPCPDPARQSSPFSEVLEKISKEWVRNHDEIYSNDKSYPSARGKLAGAGAMRKYPYAQVAYFPFSYHPVSGKLVYYGSAEISVEYKLPGSGKELAQSIELMNQDSSSDEWASSTLVNYEQIKDLYTIPDDKYSLRSSDYDYVIITTDALSSAITTSSFLSWKESLGYSPRIVLTSDPLIASEAGRDLAQKIRYFLRRHYIAWGIRYVLIVGDYTAVPMRYCFPDPTNHSFGPDNPAVFTGELPTDYYYADLTDTDDLSWDSDGDGYYGEFDQDTPDFAAEVFVGRIPVNDAALVKQTLDKITAFDQDTGTWKNNALHAGAIFFYPNQDYVGNPMRDGALFLDAIETDFMSGWNITHFSEQEGLRPSSKVWPGLNETVFTDAWRTGKHAVVNWGGHGFPNGAYRTIWSWDDGDNVAESSSPDELDSKAFIDLGSSLDTDHPSIVFAISCMVGYPEPNAYGNIGIDLLTDPGYGAAAGIICSTRIANIGRYFVIPHGCRVPPGSESICYEFNHRMIDGPYGKEKIGEALYNAKCFTHHDSGWDYFIEYMNMYDYNLYGDPSMAREGAAPSVPAAGFIAGVLVILCMNFCLINRIK